MANQQQTHSKKSERLQKLTTPKRTKPPRTNAAHPHVAYHIAIINANYADLILTGHKTIESRLARSRIPPYAVINPGETILFKHVAGPYACRATVQHVQYHDNLNPNAIDELRALYNNHIIGDNTYWARKRLTASYATLIWLADPQPIAEGPPLPRLHGRAWICLNNLTPLQSTPRTPPQP